MTIYLDMVIAVNLIMNFAVFYIVKKLIHENIGKWRILLGASVSTSIYIASIVFNITILGFSSIILGILVTYKRKDFFKAFIYAHAAAFLIGGMVTALHNYGVFQNFSFILLISSTAICYVFIIFFKRFKKEYYTLEIYANDEKKVLKAFLDTGNGLTFETMPVIIINHGHFEEKTYIQIPYKTVAEEGFLKAFVPEKIILNEREIFAFVAISEMTLNQADALIGPALIN
ncbi:MAG: sigma-E processing peptidase SpoIIGA [Defluviitaleaceae bacterium]|nr:sigma-E processing peptidase SpoIIGA [Defluviitaleaceae bacterium]